MAKNIFVTSALASRGNSDYIELLAKEYNNKTMKIDNEKLGILFNIISQNDVNISVEVKTFLKAFQRNFRKGSRNSKVVQKLLKDGRKTVKSD